MLKIDFGLVVCYGKPREPECIALNPRHCAPTVELGDGKAIWGSTRYFKVLMDCFLKNTKFVLSDTPSIADLAIAPAFTFIKARLKFWEAVPGLPPGHVGGFPTRFRGAWYAQAHPTHFRGVWYAQAHDV